MPAITATPTTCYRWKCPDCGHEVIDQFESGVQHFASKHLLTYAGMAGHTA